MNRLTKKCMIASAGMHLLLIVALFVGAAFIPKKSENQVAVIDLINPTITDGPTRGGGNPTVTQPPPPADPPPAAAQQVAQKEPDPQPAPPQKDPAPEPEPPKPAPVKEPDPPKVVEPVKPKEPSLEVAKTKTPPKEAPKLTPINKTPTKPTTPKPAATKPSIDFSKRVPRPKTSTSTASSSNTSTSSTANNTKLASALSRDIGKIASSIRSGAASSTSVENFGPGGEAFVRYSDLVGTIYQRAYDRALTTAGEIADRDDSVEAAVVIGRDGRIISSRITRNSGNPALNKLVKGVLDRIDSIPGFPETARDSQRTFNITFDLKSRRLTG